jgi:hypothetical protein
VGEETAAGTPAAIGCRTIGGYDARHEQRTSRSHRPSASRRRSSSIQVWASASLGEGGSHRHGFWHTKRRETIIVRCVGQVVDPRCYRGRRRNTARASSMSAAVWSAEI